MSETQRLVVTATPDGCVEARGEIDAHTVDTLRQALGGSPAGQVVVLDLAGVEFIDSSGLRVVVEQHQRCSDAGGSLVLRNPSRVVRRLLDVTGLTELLRVE